MISAIKSPNSSMIQTLSSSSMFMIQGGDDHLGWSGTSHAVSTEAGIRLARLDSWWGSKERGGVAEVKLYITELCEHPSVNCS